MEEKRKGFGLFILFFFFFSSLFWILSFCYLDALKSRPLQRRHSHCKPPLLLLPQFNTTHTLSPLSLFLSLKNFRKSIWSPNIYSTVVWQLQIKVRFNLIRHIPIWRPLSCPRGTSTSFFLFVLAPENTLCFFFFSFLFHFFSLTSYYSSQLFNKSFQNILQI